MDTLYLKTPLDDKGRRVDAVSSTRAVKRRPALPRIARILRTGEAEDTLVTQGVATRHPAPEPQEPADRLYLSLLLPDDHPLRIQGLPG